MDNIEVMGEHHEVAKFKGVYHFEDEQSDDEMEFWQYSYYSIRESISEI
ncbi:MAG: hypothetical protein HRT57_13205 [Crocinitomicaceae bacterium]|nr:hypothetical protein [Crocinitomicaceae bacterium]